MIQAEVGGAARVHPGIGVQPPGFMIRDFTLASDRGENVQISSFRGRSNLAVVFPGYSDAMRTFLEDVGRHGRDFSEQDTTVVEVVPYGPEELIFPTEDSPPFPILYDKTQAVYWLSGAMDENGRPVSLVYLTDRSGEIVSTYVVLGHALPPSAEEVLSTFDFLNQQCPELRTAGVAAIGQAQRLEQAPIPSAVAP